MVGSFAMIRICRGGYLEASPISGNAPTTSFIFSLIFVGAVRQQLLHIKSDEYLSTNCPNLHKNVILCVFDCPIVPWALRGVLDDIRIKRTIGSFRLFADFPSNMMSLWNSYNQVTIVITTFVHVTHC